MEENEIYVRTKLEIQKALLGRVTPNLRCVSLSMDPLRIILTIVYDQEPTPLERTLIAEASDYLSRRVARVLDVDVVTCPPLDRPDARGHYLYNRCEFL